MAGWVVINQFMLANIPCNYQHALIIASHSMGGHGAWHLAASTRGRVAALLPAAGWLSKEVQRVPVVLCLIIVRLHFHGRIMVTPMHGFDTMWGAPSPTPPCVPCLRRRLSGTMPMHTQATCWACRYLRESVSESRASDQQGLSDRNVHPFYQRKMQRVLHEHGVATRMRELPGKDHWWWDTTVANDGGAVFDVEMRAFIGNASLQPAGIAEGACHTHVVLDVALASGVGLSCRTHLFVIIIL